MRQIICICLVLAAAPVFAADHGIYLGAGVGHSNVKVEQDDSRFGTLKFDGGDVSYKVIAGFRFLDWLAIEANYVDLGKPDDQLRGTKAEINPHGVTLDALGLLPLGPFDLFLKAGAINWKATLNAPDIAVSTKRDGTDFTYGGGAQFRLGSLAFRAEYEAYEFSNIKDANMVAVGVTWTFF